MKNSLLLIAFFSAQLGFSQKPEFRHSSRLVLGIGEQKTASIGVGDMDLILADLNMDNRLDIIESNSDAVNYYYLNILKK